MRFAQLQRRFGLLVALAALLMSGCGLLGMGGTSCDTTVDNDIFDLIRPDLPASAVVREESCSTGLNPTYRAVFTLPATDLAAFQNVTRVTDWRTDFSAKTTDRYTDTATGATSFLYGEFGNGAVYETVFIDTSDAATYTVYYSNSFVD